MKLSIFALILPYSLFHLHSHSKGQPNIILEFFKLIFPCTPSFVYQISYTLRNFALMFEMLFYFMSFGTKSELCYWCISLIADICRICCNLVTWTELFHSLVVGFVSCIWLVVLSFTHLQIVLWLMTSKISTSLFIWIILVIL